MLKMKMDIIQMNMFPLFRSIARLGLVFAGVCALMLNPSEAKLQIVDNGTTHFYSQFRGASSGLYKPDAVLITEVYTELRKFLDENEEISRCIEDVLPSSQSGISMKDLYIGSRLNIQVNPLMRNTNTSTVWRGLTKLNGQGIELFAYGITDAVNGRWNAHILKGGSLNYKTKEDMFISQIRATLFHETGHELLMDRYYGTAFQRGKMPEHSSWLSVEKIKEKFYEMINEEYYRNVLLKESEVITLHEAFAVYCNYLCCAYIEKQPNFNVVNFINDTLLDKSVKYGIGVDYMWKYVVSLDLTAPNANEGKPRKKLYEAYLDLEKRGDVSWEEYNRIRAIWQETGPVAETSKKVFLVNALNALTRSQVQTHYAPVLPPLPLLKPSSSAH